MDAPSLEELATDTEVQFLSALGTSFRVAGREVSAALHYRAGFRVVLTDASSIIEVYYGDVELEVTSNGRELFGPTVHAGFAGNMFSREHLRQHLHGIVVSSLSQLHAAG